MLYETGGNNRAGRVLEEGRATALFIFTLWTVPLMNRTLPTFTLVLLALGLGSACKQLEPASKMPPQQIDGQLGTVLDQFLADAASNGQSVDGATLDNLRVLKFVDDIGAQKQSYGSLVASDDDDAVGDCARINSTSATNLGVAKIAGAKQSWQEVWIQSGYGSGDTAGAVQLLQELVYHELGHCLLGLGHAPAQPAQIMSPWTDNDPAWISANWSGLVGGLFRN